MITHTGMFRASCMQNTKVTMKNRMTNAFVRPSGSRNAVDHDERVAGRGGDEAADDQLAARHPVHQEEQADRRTDTASTPLATFAINAALAEKPALVSTCVP